MSNMTNNHNFYPSNPLPIAVVMISLNEAHNMVEVLENIKDWAGEIFLVDSCSKDCTIDIALSYGVNVIQRKFTGFGNQWNFALEKLPITMPWTMKLDPDERLSAELKESIRKLIEDNSTSGISVVRKLWFMGKKLSASQVIVRIWRTGKCKFTNSTVNEYPIVDGIIARASGYLEHHDSPNIEHWVNKQNLYTTLEAKNQFLQIKRAKSSPNADIGFILRMWLKAYFWKIPLRYIFLFLYHYLFLGGWSAGKAGIIWAHLRTNVYRLWEYKYTEMKILNSDYVNIPYGQGAPDGRVPFFEN